jgi:hypothetical protein
MQSDTPQGDPRLQRAKSGPRVATAYLDPCLVYVETTFSDQRPMVMVCFAAASREIVEPGSDPKLELEDVLVIRCKPHYYPDVKGCTFEVVEEKLLSLQNGALVGLPPVYYLPPKLSRRPFPVLKQYIRYLDRGTATILRERFESARSPNFPLVELAKRLVVFGKLNWPSVRQTISYKDELELSRVRPPLSRRPVSSMVTNRRRPSLLRLLVSSLSRKKTKPIPA